VGDRIRKCREPVNEASEEILSYVLKHFSRDKHEGFFTAKIRRIQAAFGKVELEVEKMASHVDRVEGSLLGDLERRIAAIEDRVVERVRRETREVLEGVRSEVSQLRAQLDNREERVASAVRVQGQETRDLVLGECRKVIEGGAKVVEQVVEARKEIASKGAGEVDGEVGGSWAEVARRPRRKKAERTMVVVQPPSEGDRGHLRKVLGGLLDRKSGEVRVKGLRSQGRNFVLEVHDRSDVDKLKSLGLEGKGFKVNGEPRLRDPKVIIFGVDREIEEGDLRESLMARNRDLFEGVTAEEAKAELRPCFRQGRAREGVNWVLQVSPRIFQRFTSRGRLYVGLRSCRVSEHIAVVRCFKCQGLGHMGRLCGAKVACGRCGEEGHHSSGCKEPQKVGCANCKRLGFKEVGHWVGWQGCPALDLAKKRVARGTKYSP
jgi:hypothetical protein